MDFIDLIKQAFAWLKSIAQRVIRGVMSFFRDIVGRFRGLMLNQQKHTPFIANAASPEFKKMLRNAPIKDVGIFSANTQVVSGVFDESTDEIIHAEILGADGMDQQTKSVLGNESIVVLS